MVLENNDGVLPTFTNEEVLSDKSPIASVSSPMNFNGKNEIDNKKEVSTQSMLRE